MCVVMSGEHHGVVLNLCCCSEVRCSDGAELHGTVCFSLLEILVQEPSEVRADPNGAAFRSWLDWFQKLTLVFHQQQSTSYTLSALEIQWGVGIALKYLECLQAAPMLKEGLLQTLQASSRFLFPQSHTSRGVCLCQDEFVYLRAGGCAEQYICLQICSAGCVAESVERLPSPSWLKVFITAISQQLCDSFLWG